jgi:hypothetical protein
MMIKATLLAMVVFFGSLTIAEAQSYFNSGTPGPSTALGWNFGHIAYCLTQDDGVNTWHYVFFPDGSYTVTNHPALAAAGALACQSGNLVGIFVVSLNPFRWNWMATYPFQ